MMGLSELRAENEARARRGEKRLDISPTLSLPLDFITGTQAILATKGRGKTFVAQTEAEEILEHRQVMVAIDPTDAWWGLRSSPDGNAAGYPIAIFGGDHGDVQLEADAGAKLAEAVVAERFSCVLCTERLSEAGEVRFVADFLRTLYRKNREPIHVFVDECDMFAPQKPFGVDEAKALGAMQNIVRRGRKKGIGCTMISQRPSVVNKDVLSQIDTLIVLGMSHPLDLAAVERWVRRKKTTDLTDAMLEELAEAPIGDAWIWSPMSGLYQKFRAREKRTFDSGATPKIGEKTRDAKVLAPVDIKRLGAMIAETVERAKQDDPKALLARIAELELRSGGGTRIIEKLVEIPAIDGETLDSLRAAIGELDKRTMSLATAIGELDRQRDRLAQSQQAVVSEADNLRRFAEKLGTAKSNRQLAAEHFANDGKIAKRVGKHEIRVPAPKPDEKPAEKHVDRELAVRVLDTIFVLRAAKLEVTFRTVAAWVGCHPNNKSLLTAVGVMRAEGNLDGLDLTQSGLLNVSKETRGMTENDLRARFRAGLSDTQARIVDTIKTIGMRGAGVTHKMLAAWLGVHPNNKTLLDDLGRLRDRGYLNGLTFTEIGGRVAIGTVHKSSADLLASLDESQRGIAEIVVRRGSVATMTALADELGLHKNNKTLLESLGKLRSRGLVTDGWPLQPTDVLDPEAR